MSNRPVFLLWISVHVEGQRHFRLFIPVPLFLLLMLSDIAEDFSCLAPLFFRNRFEKHRGENRHAPGQTAACPEVSPALIRNAASVFSVFMRELVFHTGPLDLADIDVRDENGTVRVRCLIR